MCHGNIKTLLWYRNKLAIVAYSFYTCTNNFWHDKHSWYLKETSRFLVSMFRKFFKLRILWTKTISSNSCGNSAFKSVPVGIIQILWHPRWNYFWPFKYFGFFLLWWNRSIISKLGRFLNYLFTVLFLNSIFPF